MKEFWWSVVGSAAIGGVVTGVANSNQFNQHWNFLIVWGILFVVYWILRATKGDVDFDFDW
ncbi:hypothetical protein SEA_BEUFFERT_214 [Streptomyces phage Beuffert]|nr:hypothetical protein SEA_BEUFFERT_214 [Streptomyces phage Beuffert]